jgi:hypothetical protein
MQTNADAEMFGISSNRAELEELWYSGAGHFQG